MLNKLYNSLSLLLLSSVVHAANPWQWNMPQGVTPISHDMYQLHMIAMWVCAGIGLVVFGVMFYSLLYHRKSKGHKPATFHHNQYVEIIWTIIPFVILVGLAVPATQILMRMDDTDNAELTIKVVGYQWKWEYSYLEHNVNFFSSLATPYKQINNQDAKNEWYLLEVDHPVVVPIHKKIRFLVTSNDVIHSWWVTKLGIKRDAIPGFMHEAWARIEKPGTYRGQCTELCGVYHGFMPIVVHAVPEDEFNRWIASQQKQPTPETRHLSRQALMTLGKEKYEAVCAACHQPNGRGIPPLYPALKGSSVAVGHPIVRHIDLILNGVEGSAMQPYRDQLNDEEIAAIVTYERNAWENNTDEEVQPDEVAAARQQNQQPVRIKTAQKGGIQ
ncbi:MAG: cytochrome c oxidase subunit II [Legionella sp. 21-45-4]|nr:MAG: cytochrome c oxidase subunit II [Legionella sp. 21-45-4]